jgi:hypothetical protein
MLTARIIKNARASKRRRQRVAGRGSNSLMRIPHPPTFRSTFELKKKVRFVTTSSSTGVVFTRGNFLNLLLMANSTTTTSRLFEAVKVNRVRIWGPPGIATSPSAYVSNEVSVQWLSNLGKSSAKSDSSMSIEPSFVDYRPPRLSLAGFWSLSGENESEELVELVFPSSAIIDFDLQIVLEREFPTSGPTGSALVPSQTYIHTGLSGVVPVDYPTF